MPAVCKSVFFCLFQNNSEGLYALVQPLRKLPAGVVLFSPGSRFRPEGKFIELPQSRCPSILSATIIGIFLYAATHPFPFFLCSMHIPSLFAHFLSILHFESGYNFFITPMFMNGKFYFTQNVWTYFGSHVLHAHSVPQGDFGIISAGKKKSNASCKYR